MNRKLTLTALLALTAICASAQIAPDTDWAQFGRYAADNEKVTEKPLAVLMGDSITDNWDREDPDFFPENNIVGHPRRNERSRLQHRLHFTGKLSLCTRCRRRLLPQEILIRRCTSRPGRLQDHGTSPALHPKITIPVFLHEFTVKI